MKQSSHEVFNFKTFLISVLFVGTAAVSKTNTLTSIELSNLMQQQQKSNFVLKPSSTGLGVVASHRSHASHASHGSHGSHRSHASSSYSTPSYSTPSYTEPSYSAPIFVSTYAMTINTTPQNARVQIMNIKPVYYDGIKLPKGKYTIRVSRPGYRTGNYVVDLDSDSIYSVILDRK